MPSWESATPIYTMTAGQYRVLVPCWTYLTILGRTVVNSINQHSWLLERVVLLKREMTRHLKDCPFIKTGLIDIPEANLTLVICWNAEKQCLRRGYRINTGSNRPLFQQTIVQNINIWRHEFRTKCDRPWHFWIQGPRSKLLLGICHDSFSPMAGRHSDGSKEQSLSPIETAVPTVIFVQDEVLPFKHVFRSPLL